MAEKCASCGQDLPVAAKPEVDLHRTPRILEGDATPAGYLGYDGPKEEGKRTEGAGTTTLDAKDAKPLDPKLAGPDAQRQAQPKQDDAFAELSPEEVARRKAQRGGPPPPVRR